MQSNRYTLLYALGFSSAVAILLAVTASGLRPLQEANEAQAKRNAILESVMVVNPETLEQDYATYITELVFDVEANQITEVAAFDLDMKKELKKADPDRRYPVYIFEKDGRTNYIIPLQGKGLWGPISAFIALDANRDSIYGVVFDHEKETPGLGAEISTTDFEDRFKGKELFTDAGIFESVRVLKGSGNITEGNAHEVDGLTGSTMTLNGVNQMMKDELARYESILKQIAPSTP